VADPYLLQNPQAAWRVYDGQAVIVSPEDSTLHTLNEVGTVVWEAADGRTPLSAIVARVHERYDVDAPAAERDVQAFVEQLRSRGLITVLDAPSNAH
jgi:hypothetical protein